MARIPDEELARIKSEVSLLRLVEQQGYEVTRQGKDYVIKCPFTHHPLPRVAPCGGHSKAAHILGSCAKNSKNWGWLNVALSATLEKTHRAAHADTEKQGVQQMVG